MRNFYYLGNASNDEPVSFILMGSTKRTDRERVISRKEAEAKANLMWRLLPSGSSVEFEVQEIGWQVKEQLLGVLLNTEPAFWHEVELLTRYTSKFRTFKQEQPIQ